MAKQAQHIVNGLENVQHSVNDQRTPNPQKPVLRPIELSRLPELPLVSVLMSNYNYARYIGQAIESVLRQTYPHFELIIVDDGSSDDSVAVVQFFLHDSRVRLLQQANGGQAAGFNTAYQHSHGDIICLLDADDLYLPTKLDRIVRSLRLNPDCGCVVNGILRVDAKLRPRGLSPLLSRLPSGWCAMSTLNAGGVLPGMPCTQGLNFRREVAEALFPLPTSRPLNRFPDMVMMKLVPLLASIAAVPEPLVKMRLHNTNSYQRKRITADALGLELELAELSWKQQFACLDKIDERLTKFLAPLDAAPVIALQKYIRARLEGTADQKFYLQRLMASLNMYYDSTWRRAFWYSTSFLPRFVFQRLVDLLFTPNIVKQAIFGFRRLSRRKHCDSHLQEAAACTITETK